MKNKINIIIKNICKHFKMPYIEFTHYKLKRNISGEYNAKDIKISTNIPIGSKWFFKTLLHELAHHLYLCRFNNRVEGFYEIINTKEMIADFVDENGTTWYAPKGNDIKVYCKIGTSHGRIFKQCLKEIEIYYENKNKLNLWKIK